MKIALIQPPVRHDWEQGEIDRITGLLRASEEDLGFSLVPTARDADLVVLLESCTFKTRHDLPAYRALLDAHGADRLYCINYEDGPPGFLPGLYSSLESFRFDADMHRSWPHLKLPNQRADLAPADEPGIDQPYLFTFSGACSHPLRRVLFETFEAVPGRHKVREIRKWYDHNEAELLAYVVDIRSSKFVLCPRGIASYSHRILETIALGRVPVVIADDWVPFSIPEDGYCLRVEERRIGEIDRLLEAAEDRYDELRARARDVYLKYYAPGIRYAVALRQLIALHRRRAAHIDRTFLLERWSSRRFWKSNGWCLEQRLARRLQKLVSA